MFDPHNSFMRRTTENEESASICTRCFATVGRGRSEKHLEECEKKHVCDKDVLHRLGVAAD